MNKVLVTGANGFIGAELCRYLCDAGCEVQGLVRSIGDASDLLPSVRYHTYTDISDVASYEALLRGMDGVIHLAARVHRMKEASRQPLEEYRRVNVQGSIQLAEAAARAGVRRFVYLSSIKAESGELSDPYGLSKREAETELARIASATGLELVIFRPSLVYGPGVKANFNSLMRWALSGVPLPLAGLSNRRSYLYIANLTDAIYLGLVHEQAAGCTFPVADGSDLSTTELIRRITEAAGKRPRLFRIPGMLTLLGAWTGKAAAIERLTGSLTTDIGLLRERLGWEPPYSIEHGMRQTVAWHIESRGRPGHDIQ